MSGDLIDPVRSWRTKGSIPLEFEAARHLALHGFEVAQGRGYETATAEGRPKVREIDVLGSFGSVEPRTPVSIVVECKHTVSKPWVVLANQRQLSTEETLSAVVAHREARATLLHRLTRRYGRGVPEFLAGHERPGFSVVVAHTDDADDRNRAWEAMAEVVGAAEGIVRAQNDKWSLGWPAILIDGPLAVVSYPEDGPEELAQVAWKRIMWTASPYGRPGVVVDIVTRDALASYAKSAHDGLAVTYRLISDDFTCYSSSANEDELGNPRPLVRS